jgi:amidase
VASDQDLVRATACAIVDKLNSGEVTPLDLLDVLERRIAEVDGKVNALPTLCFDRARTHARALMKKPVGDRGLLAGMPIPIKDLFNVEGVLNTQGSPIFKDTIAKHSDIVVETLEGNGAVVYAKSNTPEFGAGANTFNEVFGATLNPWDLSRSAAGSSGGAAVALATGTAWLAHCTDMGGSLRNPASFCGVVGMRPDFLNGYFAGLSVRASCCSWRNIANARRSTISGSSSETSFGLCRTALTNVPNII